MVGLISPSIILHCREIQHKLDNMDVIRILLADDHDLVRAGFRSLVQSFPGVEVVGEAGDSLRELR